ncbi:MAG TPA: hypothetical protein VHF06_24050 [Pseudonocardiaceae bacterium]|nr:hypothetical protein [Pseudonocardiaceae bacterium]
MSPDFETDRAIRVEPLIDLEWSRAVEPTGPIGAARRPSQVRRAWIHRAPESQVVNLYNSARRVVAEMSAPWWLRALAAGNLQSRLGGFAVEDQVSDLLIARSGWFYMPWTGPGEDGYWEFLPSDEGRNGRPLVPTTLVFTDRHAGWLDVFPAHAEGATDPIAVWGPADLRRRLDEIERSR